MAVQYDQLHIMTNYPTKYENFRTNDSELLQSQTEAGWTDGQTNRQTEKLHAPIL